ncbi:MAG: S41 family peptidase [Phycisphaerales bacterium]|nr:S41 family peptidase [Phycisphaerales bacterium]
MSNVKGGRFRRLALGGTLVFLVGVFAARLPVTLAQVGLTKPAFMTPIEDVYRALMSDYVDQPDAEKLQEGAINGMLEALNDDYAEYIPESKAAEFEKEMTGHFVGIGCQIEMRDGWLTVVSPLEDSPALAAGIIANDRITKVEGKSTYGLTADDCIKMLTGEPETKVSFVVERDGRELPFTLTRAPITNRAVRGLSRKLEDTSRWNYLIDPKDRIAYIRLSQFTPDAADELAEAIESAAAEPGTDGQPGKGIGGLILDLRNNPGGVMDGALAIADMFLEGGTIMSIRGRAPLGGGGAGGQVGRAGGASEEVFVAEKDGTLPDFPMVVLVNEGSASASEIVSGALSDHGRAVVVGTRTFGKGLVQSVAHLRRSPRAQVKFTTQRYYLPKGKLIQRTDEATEWGVDPTRGFFVPMTDQEKLESFIKRRDWDVLRKGGVIGGDAPADSTVKAEPQKWSDAAWVRDVALDKQLAAGLEALQGRVATGVWKPVSEISQPTAKLADKELHDLLKTRDRLGLEFARIDKRIATLEKVATGEESASAAKRDAKSLWPDALDLTGGRVKVIDKDGKEVATLAVTGRDLERWLVNADVKVEGAETKDK